MTERTLEQLNQTELSKATKELLLELGVFPNPNELYLIQYLEIMQALWQAEMQWNPDYPLHAWAAYGVNPILSNAYDLTPEWQYRVMTNNLECEWGLQEMMEASLKWHREHPEDEITDGLWEDQDLLTEIFPVTSDNLEMEAWKNWQEEMEETAGE